MARYSSSSTHRCVYGSIGFNRGVHEWMITILRRPCCGYIGVARGVEDPANRGDYNRFHDRNTCIGANNFSGDRNMGNDAGTTCRIRLDCDQGRITYFTRHGARNFKLNQKLKLHKGSGHRLGHATSDRLRHGRLSHFMMRFE